MACSVNVPGKQGVVPVVRSSPRPSFALRTHVQVLVLSPPLATTASGGGRGAAVQDSTAASFMVSPGRAPALPCFCVTSKPVRREVPCCWSGVDRGTKTEDVRLEVAAGLHSGTSGPGLPETGAGRDPEGQRECPGLDFCASCSLACRRTADAQFLLMQSSCCVSVSIHQGTEAGSLCVCGVWD